MKDKLKKIAEELMSLCEHDEGAEEQEMSDESKNTDSDQGAQVTPMGPELNMDLPKSKKAKINMLGSLLGKKLGGKM